VVIWRMPFCFLTPHPRSLSPLRGEGGSWRVDFKSLERFKKYCSHSGGKEGKRFFWVLASFGLRSSPRLRPGRQSQDSITKYEVAGKLPTTTGQWPVPPEPGRNGSLGPAGEGTAPGVHPNSDVTFCRSGLTVPIDPRTLGVMRVFPHVFRRAQQLPDGLGLIFRMAAALPIICLTMTPVIARAQTVRQLNNQCFALEAKGLYAEAVKTETKALTLSRQSPGPETVSTAECLANLGHAYQDLGNYTNAEAMFEQSLQIRENVQGMENMDTMAALANLGALYTLMGRYSRAEPLLQQALKINEESSGAKSLQTAGALTSFGTFYQAVGEYTEAESCFKQSEQIIKAITGANSRATLVAMNNLANLEIELGNYAEAKPLLEQVLASYQKMLGATHPNVGSVMESLGTLYSRMGDYAKAESYYDQAKAILNKDFGGDTPNTVGTLSGLAMLYMNMGDYVKAMPLIQRTLEIDEKTLGPDHPLVADMLDQLAQMYTRANNFAAAEKLDERVLAIDKKALGMESPLTANALIDLGSVYFLKGSLSKAKSCFEQAIAIDEKALGEENPRLASGLSHLSVVEEKAGDYSESKALKERALEIDEKVLGAENPATANVMEGLAYSDIDLQQTNEAIQYAQKDEASHLTMLNNILSFTSEQERLNYEGQNDPYELFASLNDTPDLAQAVLRHKGVVLDSLLEDQVLERASSDPDYKALIEQLEPAKRRLTQLTMTVPKEFSLATLTNRFNDYEKLSDEVDELEGTLARDVTGFGQARQALTVTVGQVQQAIPSNAVLVEFIYYNHYIGHFKAEARYGAVVFSASGAPAWVCLGSADEINKAENDYQMALAANEQGQLLRAIHKLYKKVWQPVEALFPPGTKITIVSPDGTLNFVSFATLLAGDDHFLAEKYSFRYVASGRDLLRQPILPSNQDLVIFASPDYYAGGEVNWQEGLELEPLPDMETQAIDVGEMAKPWGWNTHIYAGDAATEAQARAVQSPYILEFATHGFVLPPVIRGPITYSLLGIPQYSESPVRVVLPNPMSRSGVALVGAQVTLDAWQRGEVPPTENDGILTAEEVGGMNLQGTWLVVLSACDTGLGLAKLGEGVMGLRRGFVQAGAQNLLMTLWPVYDTTGNEIIEDFYSKLHDDNNPPEALAEVQRDWLVKLRASDGLLSAVSLAGPFIVSSQGPVQ